MPPQFDAFYAASIWVIPLIIAITFHEAAHGYVARFFGDNTAWQFGRVTLNPFKHIDPIGTICCQPYYLYLDRLSFSGTQNQFQLIFVPFVIRAVTWCGWRRPGRE